MKNSLRILPVIFALLFMQSNLLAGNNQAMNEIPIKPDECIQAKISRIVIVKNREELSREISKLKEMGSTEHLLQQLMYFDLKHMKGEEGMFIALVSRELLDIDESKIISYKSAESVINAVLPYLETKNLYFYEILYLNLAIVECVGAHEADYSKYELYIEKRKNNPPLILIEYMYGDSGAFSYGDSIAGEALLSLMRVYMKDPEEKELLALHEEIIRKNIKSRDYTDAIPSLSELFQYKEWWIHLYVAEIMKQHPQIKSPDIIQRLKQDEHPLVQKVLNELGDR